MSQKGRTGIWSQDFLNPDFTCAFSCRDLQTTEIYMNSEIFSKTKMLMILTCLIPNRSRKGASLFQNWWKVPGLNQTTSCKRLLPCKAGAGLGCSTRLTRKDVNKLLSRVL